jgi:hypothetical protein
MPDTDCWPAAFGLMLCTPVNPPPGVDRQAQLAQLPLEEADLGLEGGDRDARIACAVHRVLLDQPLQLGDAVEDVLRHVLDSSLSIEMPSVCLVAKPSTPISSSCLRWIPTLTSPSTTTSAVSSLIDRPLRVSNETSPPPKKLLMALAILASVSR